MATISNEQSPRKVLIGVDIGATSIKVGAFSEHGRELVVVHRPNAPVPQPDFPGGIIWNLARMRRQAFDALREVVSQLDGAEPVGIGVTAFGADGELVHEGGVTRLPGLYAIGYRFLRRRNSSFISGVGGDAEELADHISGHLRHRRHAA